MIDKLFGTAICAVGGARGGVVVPRWFSALPGLGIEHACVFWSVSGGQEGLGQLDVLRTSGNRWLADLRALGMSSELVLKRGRPGPWLTALARIVKADLIVIGPPSARGRPSDTLRDLMEDAPVPLLLLPEGGRPMTEELLARPLVDLEGPPESRALVAAWTAGRCGLEPLRMAGLEPRRVARQVVREAVERDATSLVLAGCSPDLAAQLLQYGAVPLLIAPRRPRLARGGFAPLESAD